MNHEIVRPEKGKLTIFDEGDLCYITIPVDLPQSDCDRIRKALDYYARKDARDAELDSLRRQVARWEVRLEKVRKWREGCVKKADGMKLDDSLRGVYYERAITVSRVLEFLDSE